jgi:peptidylprolyl isomerase domain and WD repeat-containing protein 1
MLLVGGSAEKVKRVKQDVGGTALLEHHYLENMPSADMYERSYMHKDVVCQSKSCVIVGPYSFLCIVMVSMKYDYIFTMSVDGFLKFWKKVQNGIEFVKTFRAHVGKITGCSLSSNEQRLATVCSKDQALKVFDVVNFDLMHMIKLKFVPELCEFINKHSSFSYIIAITQ